MSFINKTKSKGPRIYPCGTPELTDTESEKEPSITTLSSRSCKYSIKLRLHTVKVLCLLTIEWLCVRSFQYKTNQIKALVWAAWYLYGSRTEYPKSGMPNSKFLVGYSRQYALLTIECMCVCSFQYNQK